VTGSPEEPGDGNHEGRQEHEGHAELDMTNEANEHPGYVLNSLLNPLLDDALGLLVDGIAEPETVDKTWRIGTGSPLGPFQILDMIGWNY
jgi:3-hydroxyacyl-CoA dehydrogenase